jgi:ribulose kinase
MKGTTLITRKRLAVYVAVCAAIALPLVALTIYVPEWPMMVVYIVVVGGICEDSNILSSSCKVTPAVMTLKIGGLIALVMLIRWVVKWRRGRCAKGGD